MGFHQEWSADATEREQRRMHWQRVLDALVAALEKRDASEPVRDAPRALSKGLGSARLSEPGLTVFG